MTYIPPKRVFNDKYEFMTHTLPSKEKINNKEYPMIEQDKLIEMVEDCFKNIRSQAQTIKDQEAEIQSLRLKLSTKPRVEVVEKDNELYKKYQTKLFVILKEELEEKDNKIAELSKKVSKLTIENADLKSPTTRCNYAEIKA